MKNFVALLLLFAFIPCNIFGNAIKLNEALTGKKIKGTIHGNSKSTHYFEPIIVDLTNISNEPINIGIDNGDMFIPNQENIQNIVVTEPQIITLQPNQRKIVKVKGMCTEKNDAAGDDSILYTFQPGKNDTLKKIANFITEKKYQTSAAQYAVWCLTNNVNLNNIIAADSSEENNLRRFMAKLTGKTFAVQSKDYKTNYYAPPREKVGGFFEYTIPFDRDVQIAMFNKDGILVRELFNQKKVTEGTHKMNFEYDSSVYTDNIYYFKLIIDNNVFMSQKWDAGAMRDRFKKKVEDKLKN